MKYLINTIGYLGLISGLLPLISYFSFRMWIFFSPSSMITKLLQLEHQGRRFSIPEVILIQGYIFISNNWCYLILIVVIALMLVTITQEKTW